MECATASPWFLDPNERTCIVADSCAARPQKQIQVGATVVQW